MSEDELRESNERANATYERTIAMGQQIIRDYPAMERTINDCMCSLWATHLMCGARLGGPLPVPPLVPRPLAAPQPEPPIIPAANQEPQP